VMTSVSSCYMHAMRDAKTFRARDTGGEIMFYVSFCILADASSRLML